MSRTTRTFALLVPFAMTAALIGAVQPAVAQVRCSRPDAQIRGGPASLSYLGDGDYGHDGSLQTFTRQVRPGFRDQFNIKMENDTQCLDTFFVQGAGSSMKYVITYYSVTPLGVLVADETAQVVAGTFQTSALAAGESEFLRVYIGVRPGVRSGSSIRDLIAVGSSGTGPEADARAFADPDVWDVVGARVVVNRRAGDFNGQRPILEPVQ